MFNSIDYVYLPYDANLKAYIFKVSSTDFERKVTTYNMSFSTNVLDSSEVFTKEHAAGLFSIKQLERDLEFEDSIKQKIPHLYKYLNLE